MREIRFLLKFKSDAGRVLKQVGAQFKKLGVVVGVVQKGLVKVAAGFVLVGKAALKAGRIVVAAATRMGAVFRRLTASIRTAGAALAGFGLAIGLGAVIKTLADFEFAMARVKGITEATTLEFQALSETARFLGATTFFTATEAANGLRLLAQAGFSVGESIQTVASTLDLAIAGNLDLASATDITASVLRGFNLAASQSTRVVDVLTAVSINANTTVFELGEAMKLLAPAASAAGVTLEEAAAAIGIMSNAGLKGTLAGTGLRRVIVGLLKVTPKGAKALERMGLTIDDVRITTVGFTKSMETLAERSLSAADAFELFGLRGGPAAIVVTKFNKELQKLTGTAEDAENSAKDLAKVVGDTLVGDFKALRSAMEETFLQQQGLSAGFRDIVQQTTGVLRALAGLGDPLDENAGKFEEIAQGIRDFGSSMMNVIGVISLFLTPAKLMLKVTLGVADAFGWAAEQITNFSAGVVSFIQTTQPWIARALGIDEATQQLSVSLSNQNAILKQNADQIAENTERLETLKAAELTPKDLATQLPGVERALERTGKFVERLKKEIAAAQEQVKDGLNGELRTNLREMQLGLAAAESSMAKLAETAEGMRVVRDELEFAAEAGKLLQAEADSIEDQLRTMGEAIGALSSIEDAISSQEFELAQLALGSGAAATLQRELNEALKGVGLLEIDPPAFAAQEAAFDARIKQLQKERDEVEKLSKAQADFFEAQIAANELGLKKINEQREARIKLRKEFEKNFETIKKQEELFKAQEEAVKLLETGLKKVFDGLATLISDFVVKGELNFRDFAANILQQFIKLGIDLALQGVLTKITGALAPAAGAGAAGAGAGAAAGGGGLGGLLGALGPIGGILTGFFAKGGMAESPSRKARVPAAAFIGARRFQAGGPVDSIPALLSPGERVLTAAQNQAFESGGGMGNVTINIQTPDVAGFNRSKGQIAAEMQSQLRRAGQRNN